MCTRMINNEKDNECINYIIHGIVLMWTCSVVDAFCCIIIFVNWKNMINSDNVMHANSIIYHQVGVAVKYYKK